MRIYFLTEDNSADLETMFNDLYISTLGMFEKKLDFYQSKEITEQITESIEEQTFNKIMVEEFTSILHELRNDKFKKTYIKWELEILEKIRYASVSTHTDKCIARAVFDILFKFCFDFEYKIFHLCCNNTRFKTLQFEILRDLRWKLRPDFA